MRALKTVGRVLYLILSIATIVAGINIFFLEENHTFIAYLVIHSLCFLLSIPLLICVNKWVARRTKKAALARIIAVIFSLYLVAPVTMLISFVREFVALVRGIGTRSGDRIEYSVSERREIYHISAAAALESILDPTTARDVTLDDGITTMTLKQVATVDCLGKRYALLAEAKEDGEGYTYAYEIRPRDGRDGALTLIPVVDEKTYRAVYSAYKQLLTL